MWFCAGVSLCQLQPQAMERTNLAHASDTVGMLKVYSAALRFTVTRCEYSILRLTQGPTAYHLGRLVADIRSQVQLVEDYIEIMEALIEHEQALTQQG